MEENQLTQLSPEEIRVLGALIEKSKTTPDYYPLTLNSLVTACNQKSSRNPVVEYDDETVVLALDNLKKKQLIANVIGDGRTLKYRQTLAVKHPLDPAELTVLCLLFLRGPLTAGEINSNSGRLHEFDSLQEVQQNLENLASYEQPFIKLLPKKAGQKEARYVHTFSAFDENDFSPSSISSTNSSTQLEERVLFLENQVAELKEKLDKLYNELM